MSLALVEASWERVIRTTVGLRPHRPSGFVVKTDKLDDKTLVHNYGHGGAGMSLSWGTGHLAARDPPVRATPRDALRAILLSWCGSRGASVATTMMMEPRPSRARLISNPEMAVVSPPAANASSLAGRPPASCSRANSMPTGTPAIVSPRPPLEVRLDQHTHGVVSLPEAGP